MRIKRAGAIKVIISTLEDCDDSTWEIYTEEFCESDDEPLPSMRDVLLAVGISDDEISVAEGRDTTLTVQTDGLVDELGTIFNETLKKVAGEDR